MIKIGIIKNKAYLATSKRRRQALDIIEAGIMRVQPDNIIYQAVSFDPARKSLIINHVEHPVRGRLFVIGGGKAAGLMARTLEQILGTDIIETGLVIDKARPDQFEMRKIKIVQAGHPLPDIRGVEAVRAIVRLKEQYAVGKEDTVLCLISGGGSSLMPYPLENITLNDKQQVTRLLLACGADIREINSVRKHLSRIKGGKLAQHFAPARVISLILSDVIGNDLGVIASGLTFPDSSTFAEAHAVLEKYRILDQVPAAVLTMLERGQRGEMEETPKTLDNVDNYIIGDVRFALEAMRDKAVSMGLRPVIVTAEQSGETTIAAGQRAREILEGAYRGYRALLLGGETTPCLPDSSGKGGRNQHFAALTPLLLEDYTGEWVCASMGTDGSDFIPDIAGAIVDQQTLQAYKTKAPEYRLLIKNYDSHTLLQKAGNSLIITGNTNTNVGDIMVYLLDLLPFPAA
jgi:glycerate 2-kinase